MKIYRYVVRNDDGSAPNYFLPCVTLAICKPAIRRVASVGDWVIGFESISQRRRPNVVRWAGIISEKLSFAEYWNDTRFKQKRPERSHRPDNIYRPDGAWLEQVRNSVHGSGNIETDIGGKYVLIFEKSWIFGEDGPEMQYDTGLRLDARHRQGHRVSHCQNEEMRKIEEWLDCQSGRKVVVKSGPEYNQNIIESCEPTACSPPRKKVSRKNRANCAK